MNVNCQKNWIFLQNNKKKLGPKDDRETTSCNRKYNYFHVDNPELVDEKENDEKSSNFGSDYEHSSQGYTNDGGGDSTV